MPPTAKNQHLTGISLASSLAFVSLPSLPPTITDHQTQPGIVESVVTDAHETLLSELVLAELPRGQSPYSASQMGQLVYGPINQPEADHVDLAVKTSPSLLELPLRGIKSLFSKIGSLLTSSTSDSIEQAALEASAPLGPAEPIWESQSDRFAQTDPDTLSRSTISLEQVTPNPAHGSFQIRFQIADPQQKYELGLYNAQGQCIADLTHSS
ncbi:MAG: hypothetical protein KDD42_06460, partial [Bdellovibrionales bacterium]|nr:hypothetical protein [Bdellovibrionales bacterium]